MSEYIKRKEAILTVQGYAKHAIDKGRKSLDTVDDTIHMCYEIDRLPAADVVPVAHGEWKPTEIPFMSENEDCSVCGYRTVYGCGWGYCPNCGARMDGGADNGEHSV